MAATDYKITNAEVSAVHVEARPTILNGSATQNKQVFDAYPDLIVLRHNQLCDFIEYDMTATIDPEVTDLYETLGWVAE
jgi:hypothetical protein